MTIARTTLAARLADFEEQAAAILAASKARRGDGLRMEVDDDAADDDTGEDSEDGDDPDDDDDSEGEWKPPTKEEFEAQQAALAKANKQARDRRLRIKQLEKGVDTDGKGTDAEKLRGEVENEVVGQWKPLVVNSAARSALAEAGLIGKPDRLLKLLDLGEIEVDVEDGSIDGLDEQVRELKKDYPNLFRKTGRRNVDAADRGEGSGKNGKMTTSELQAAALRGEL